MRPHGAADTPINAVGVLLVIGLAAIGVLAHPGALALLAPVAILAAMVTFSCVFLAPSGDASVRESLPPTVAVIVVVVTGG